ncbi:MAG TPA: methyltransferase domain-containing protein [Puia sp.]|nr:methyltransferase domain-containing protein [Puia sp.]
MSTVASQLTDNLLNSLYPPSIRALASHHWTPLPVALEASRFLTCAGDAVILDIGSGVGKFCLAAAALAPRSLFVGVEQRTSLVAYAETARKKIGLDNVSFLHGNFTQLDFRSFDHFYFYNAFYENLAGSDKIDDDIAYSRELYRYYSHYLLLQLLQRPAGTRLVTFCSSEDEIPPGYREMDSGFGGQLKFWIKA